MGIADRQVWRPFTRVRRAFRPAPALYAEPYGRAPNASLSEAYQHMSGSHRSTRFRSFRSRSRSRRGVSWVTTGALVAAGALTTGSGVAQARPAAPAPSDVAGGLLSSSRVAITRVWETPEEVLAAAWRASEVPGDKRQPALEATPANRPQAADQGEPVHRFDIATGPLAEAIEKFEQQAGVSVVVEPGLTVGRTASAVSGVLTVDQALRQLLENTGLAVRRLAGGEIELQLSISADVVNVSGALPAVSSPKFQRPLVDTPRTVNVISQEVIEAQGATTLRDVLRNVPGITMQAGEGGGGLPGDTLLMRGFSASNDIFVDGVRDVGAYSRDAYNLEQVEVVKGPASAISGRSSAGGSINLATKTPTLDSSRQVTVGAGNAGYQRTTVDVNQAVDAWGSGAALRLNAMWQDAGVPGRDVVNNASWAIAPSLALGLDGPTRLTASYEHVTQDNVPDYGLPWAAREDETRVSQHNFYGLRDYDFEDIDRNAATLHVERDLGAATTLHHTTRYSDTLRDSAITAPRPPRRQLQRRRIENDALMTQTGLTTTGMLGSVRHSLAVGVEVGREGTNNRNSAQATNQPETTLESPDPSERPFGPMPDITGNPSSAVTDTVGTYLFETVDVTRALQVTGGVRWDRSAVDYELTTLDTGDITRFDRTDSQVSWQAGAVVKPASNGSLYVGVGTSFSPTADAGNTGTALSDSPTAVNNINLEPEKGRSIEAGTKWTLFGSRLLLSLAGFHTEKSNVRTRSSNADPYVTIGRQRVAGVEIGANGQIAPGWTVYLAYADMRSKVLESANAGEVGAELLRTPRRTASLWLMGEVWPGATVGVGGQYMDAVFRSASVDVPVPSYWLLSASAAYELNSNLTLRVNGTNLTDEQYVDRVGGGHYIPGARRAVQIGLDVGF